MPIIIAIIVVVVGAMAFTVFQSSPATDTQPEVVAEEVRTVEEESNASDTTVSAEAQIDVSAEEPDISVVSEVIEDARPSDPDLTAFADGTYTTQTSYFTPRRTEHTMDITLTLENDIVVATEILWDGVTTPKTPSHSGFDAAYEAEVVGQPLNEIFLSRVGGASLTSESFNEAVETIEIEASAS